MTTTETDGFTGILGYEWSVRAVAPAGTGAWGGGRAGKWRGGGVVKFSGLVFGVVDFPAEPLVKFGGGILWWNFGGLPDLVFLQAKRTPEKNFTSEVFLAAPEIGVQNGLPPPPPRHHPLPLPPLPGRGEFSTSCGTRHWGHLLRKGGVAQTGGWHFS